MELFGKHVKEMWNKWELRVLVLLSLSWQIFLIIFGSQRKYRSSSFISFLVWIMYLSADWLATVSLGTLANDQGDSPDKNNVLKALWAPFLLLHLGGPDTITAYSLEDNSLWLRHLLQLVVQVTVAFYIYLRSWTNTALTFIVIPVFISGILKYSERTWVLRSASTQQFEDSLVSSSAETLPLSSALRDFKEDGRLECLHKAYFLFLLLKRLYANLSLRSAEGQRCFALTKNNSLRDNSVDLYDYAFNLVERQLEFLYDVLYTKAPIIYSLAGLIIRLITFFCTLLALIAFCFVIDRTYSKSDIYVTYALLAGAIFLEIYGVISLVFSDWTMRWLTKNENPMHDKVYRAILYCQSQLFHKKRWSESMAQHNLIDFCLNPRVSRFIVSDLFFGVYFTLELYWQRTWITDCGSLQHLIYDYIVDRYEEYSESGFDHDKLKSWLDGQGNFVLKRTSCFDEIGWSVEVEFDHSLLIWHVATDLCFYSDHEKQQDSSCKASKEISDYMLYILLMRPFMLPKWIDRIRYVRDTYREVISILHRKDSPVKGIADACKEMLNLHNQFKSLELLRIEKSSLSVFFDACHLAEQLLSVQDNRWKIICGVWIEKLTYAASHCEWQAHAQQLRRGGELLTHVCVLMADFSLSNQFGTGRQGPKKSKWRM